MVNPSPPQPPGTQGPLRGRIVENSPGDITPPTNIVQSVTAARSLYEHVRFENLRRLELFASIEGLIQGNPPYDPTELAQKGLSHIANFNNMDATARFEKAALGYWNLLNAAEFVAKFIFYDDTNEDFKEFADTLARNWNLVIREWPQFVRHFCCLCSQLVEFGYSSLVWPDERDWRWKPVETARLFLPDQASTDTELLTSIFIESNFSVQQLYQIYETFKDKPKDESPWNTDVVASYLLYRANTWAKTLNTPNLITSIYDLQLKLENGDVSYGWLYSDEVRLVHLLQVEYTGEVSHYIFDRLYTQVGSIGYDGFLYFVDKQYKALSDAFALFTMSPGVFTIHSNRGIGHKIFAPCQATMQLDCDIVNMARLSSTPIIRSPAAGSKDFESITMQPGVPMNIGTAEFVQNQLGANIEQLIGAGQYTLSKLSANIMYSGDDPETPDRNQGSVSDSQAKRQDYKEFGVLKNNIAHFFNQLDPVYKVMLTRMMSAKDGYPGFEAAERWKELCITQGVPKELFVLNKDGTPKHFYTKATRVAGDGSTLALIMGLETIAPFAQGFSAAGQRNFQKDFVRSIMGDDYVSAYLGDTEPDEATGGASLAQVENAVMQMGQSPLFSPDNEQKSHIAVHMELAKSVIQQRNQAQIDATTADKTFSVLIPHLQDHVDFISRNPLMQSYIESIKKPWAQIQQYAVLNRKNAEKELQAAAEKQQQQATQQNAAMSDIQRKDMVAKADVQRADFKVKSQVQRADEANTTRAEVARERVQSDAAINRLKVSLDAENKNLEVQGNRAATENQIQNTSLPDLQQQLTTLGGASPAPSDIGNFS